MKHVISTALAGALIIAPISAYAAKKPQLSSLELQQLQSKEFEVSRDDAFAAVMTVLQDSGYRIGAADRDTGLITGTASTNSYTTWLPFVGFSKKKKTPVVSAYIEARGSSVARVRLNFVMTEAKANQFGSDAGEEPILDPIVYKEAFEKVEKEVFVRMAMKNGPSVTSPAGANIAPAVAPVATPVVMTTTAK